MTPITADWISRPEGDFFMLGELPGKWAHQSHAHAFSADGSINVCRYSPASGGQNFVWVGGTPIALGDQPRRLRT